MFFTALNHPPQQKQKFETFILGRVPHLDGAVSSNPFRYIQGSKQEYAIIKMLMKCGSLFPSRFS